jgi:hypothetical protein
VVFAVAVFGFGDAFTGSTHEFISSASWFLWWAHLIAIDREDAGAAFLHNLIRSILTVTDTVTELALLDALA